MPSERKALGKLKRKGDLRSYLDDIATVRFDKALSSLPLHPAGLASPVPWLTRIRLCACPRIRRQDESRSVERWFYTDWLNAEWCGRAGPLLGIVILSLSSAVLGRDPCCVLSCGRRCESEGCCVVMGRAAAAMTKSACS